ncbi:MAG: amidophosphoribosyltransferase [Oscillospiraceae bacterium]|nr:amidophosphoribosyltransferase [Oscillospiraceae bacterium]
MGGLFGAASKNDCVFDVFFGTDYHSHLGTRRAGMVVYDKNKGFDRSIHNIENSPFRTKFADEMNKMHGQLGIGCISDYEPQPIMVRSHLGTYAITTVGRINNADELIELVYSKGHTHFLEMSGGEINPTELCASIINQKGSISEGIAYAQELIKGSMSMLVMTDEGIYAARDALGRTPLVIGKKEDGYCVAFEDFSFFNLGYEKVRELGPGEIVYITADSEKTLKQPGKKMKICTFLWVYYGYPCGTYEGESVEAVRNRCGAMLAMRDKDDVKPDVVAGVPDSGTAHAIGYANASGVPFARPFIKYTPTWPRSFMPPTQQKRKQIAKMKILPVTETIKDKSLLLIDDSIVRGTQLGETTQFLYDNGAKEVHVRPACPPILFGCKYLNFSRSTSELDLITRRVILENEGDNAENVLSEYANPESERYQQMLDIICKKRGFTSLKYNRLDDMIKAVGIDPECLCTYCWDGKE